MAWVTPWIPLPNKTAMIEENDKENSHLKSVEIFFKE